MPSPLEYMHAYMLHVTHPNLSEESTSGCLWLCTLVPLLPVIPNATYYEQNKEIGAINRARRGLFFRLAAVPEHMRIFQIDSSR
ncbi:hypothetical protein Pelo_6267 [Pelomyxa schiedti]|nr:hypothetical protein Pelo_6267 [Pelomyxa schiedti]